MTYVDKSAVYALNSYLWKLLQVNLGWTTVTYDGRQAVPIIPSGQQPEFKDLGIPFIVYGSAIQTASHLYALVNESVSYTIYAETSTEVSKIANLINEAFSRQDESATFVNDHIGDSGEDRQVHFKSIRVTMIQKAEPSENEGGYGSSFVMLQTSYTSSNETAQLTGFTYP